MGLGGVGSNGEITNPGHNPAHPNSPDHDDPPSSSDSDYDQYQDSWQVKLQDTARRAGTTVLELDDEQVSGILDGSMGVEQINNQETAELILEQQLGIKDLSGDAKLSEADLQALRDRGYSQETIQQTIEGLTHVDLSSVENQGQVVAQELCENALQNGEVPTPTDLVAAGYPEEQAVVLSEAMKITAAGNRELTDHQQMALATIRGDLELGRLPHPDALRMLGVDPKMIEQVQQQLLDNPGLALDNDVQITALGDYDYRGYHVYYDTKNGPHLIIDPDGNKYFPATWENGEPYIIRSDNLEFQVFTDKEGNRVYVHDKGGEVFRNLRQYGVSDGVPDEELDPGEVTQEEIDEIKVSDRVDIHKDRNLATAVYDAYGPDVVSDYVNDDGTVDMRRLIQDHGDRL